MGRGGKGWVSESLGGSNLQLEQWVGLGINGFVKGVKGGLKEEKGGQKVVQEE